MHLTLLSAFAIKYICILLTFKLNKGLQLSKEAMANAYCYLQRQA